MATVAELVAGVLEDGQVDATEAQVLRWLSTRQRQMCARARNYRKTIVLGETVAGQASYPLTLEGQPLQIEEILQVTVGGMVYGTSRHNDFAEGERGWLWLGGGEGGIAGREDSATGEQELRIFPAPTSGVNPEPGAKIVLYCSMLPPALVVGEDSTIKIPDDYVDALISGALATAMLRIESRGDLASEYEQVFTTGCAELLRATNKKFRGVGPAKVRIIGVNA